MWYTIQLNLCKTVTLKKTKNGFPNQLSLNAGQKYCRMLQREHSAILSTFIKLPVVIKTFALSIFEVLLHKVKVMMCYEICNNSVFTTS